MAHRIDHPTALPGGFFTEGDPVNGIVPTRVTDDWLNDLQENVMEAIEAAGLTLTKGSYTQLTAAIQALANATINAADILTKIKTVDGTGSGLDSDLLDGQDSAYYRNAGNLNAGTLLLDRLPATLTGKDADTVDGFHFSREIISVSNPDDAQNYTFTMTAMVVGEIKFLAGTFDKRATAVSRILRLNFPAGGTYEVLHTTPDGNVNRGSVNSGGAALFYYSGTGTALYYYSAIVRRAS